MPVYGTACHAAVRVQTEQERGVIGVWTVHHLLMRYQGRSRDRGICRQSMSLSLPLVLQNSTEIVIDLLECR